VPQWTLFGNPDGDQAGFAKKPWNAVAQVIDLRREPKINPKVWLEPGSKIDSLSSDLCFVSRQIKLVVENQVCQ